MSYNLGTDLANDLTGIFHGTTLDSVVNLYQIYSRAARRLLLDCDPIETKRSGTLSQIYNSVYDYAVPTDLKGTKVIDIRPQAKRWPSDQYEQAFARWFDAYKGQGFNNAFNIQHSTGVKTLRLEAPSLPTPITLTDTSDKSLWTAGGTASNISLDTTFNVAGGGAIQFDVTTGTGYIYATALPQTDLTTHLSIAEEFYWAYFPSAPTSVELRWGSSDTAYYYLSVTTQADGTAFVAGWNRIGHSWVNATKVGTPTITAYDSVRFTVVAPAAMVGVKFCNLTSALGAYFDMVYYSKYLFNRAGTWVEAVTDDTTDSATTVNLDTESYNLFTNLVAYYICQQLQGSDARADMTFFKEEYAAGLKRYTAMNKSEVSLPSEPYYKIPHGNNFNVSQRYYM